MRGRPHRLPDSCSVKTRTTGDDGAHQAYVTGIAPAVRPLFDRIDGLIRGAFPAVTTTISYDMPTYVVGDRRLYLAAWKQHVSLYGWSEGRDGGFVDRHPELTSGRGTIKLRPKDAAAIDDDELRSLIAGALGA
jgi:uncharacterized protein YdhG (YjbR/CyaY superfamily)